MIFKKTFFVCLVFVSFWWGIAEANRSGYFINSGQMFDWSISKCVALGDLDGDGDLDAFVVNYGTNNNGRPNKVWLNNGSGTFIDSRQRLGSSLSTGVALGDLDGDGDLDAFVTNVYQSNKVWLNNGSGTFIDSGQRLVNVYSLYVALGDLDGDGDLDAFVTDGAARMHNKVWLNNGSGTFIDSGQKLGRSRQLALGDIDGDGDLDAFVVSSFSITIFLNNGSGNFDDSGQRLGGRYMMQVALGDLDGDGDLDAFVTHYNTTEPNKVWLNNGLGTFNDSGQRLGKSNSVGIALGDFDGDSDLDAFVANQNSNWPDTIANKVWLNNGLGTFDDSGQRLGNFDSCYVALGDLDGDGDLDAFVGNDGHDKVWLYQTITNYPPAADAGENLSIKSDEIAITTIIGTATDEDPGDVLFYRWKEGEVILKDWTSVGENGECPLELIMTSLTIGSHTLILEVSDEIETVSDDMILTIENSAPHAAPSGAGVYEILSEVTLGGVVSDYDGDLLLYDWKEGDTILFSGSIQAVFEGIPVQLPQHVISDLSLGDHTIFLLVDDGVNSPVSSEILVTIQDTGEPTLAPVANKAILWPPNHQMVDIIIQANASDNSGIAPVLTASVSSNEPEDGTGDGDTAPDWTEPVIDQENGIITLQLRAERSGSGAGRVYTITITATDQSANSSTVDVNIIVPHDKRKKIGHFEYL